MNLRTFQPGDETAQVAIFNQAAAALPKFKPAAEMDVKRRVRARDFDPSTRLFAEENGLLVGYITFHPNGRVGYPWTFKGYERAAEPLFEQAVAAMKERGIGTAFAAYRADWAAPIEFFKAHGFRLAREMVNFAVDQADMPTRTGRINHPVTPLRREDLPAVLALAPEALRVRKRADLEAHFFENPYFEPKSAFVLRSRSSEEPLAVGVLIDHPEYAHPRQIDPAMPCYRLGAFGTEGMQTKRVNGLFSFLTKPGPDANLFGIELMQYATGRLEETDTETLAAQAPSDAPHLVRFYQHIFRRQGSFPVYERSL